MVPPLPYPPMDVPAPVWPFRVFLIPATIRGGLTHQAIPLRLVQAVDDRSGARPMYYAFGPAGAAVPYPFNLVAFPPQPRVRVRVAVARDPAKTLRFLPGAPVAQTPN